MKYGVVGNRNGWMIGFVLQKLRELNISASDTIISGGADGVDSMAQTYAKLMGCTLVIHYPDPKLSSPYRYFARNKDIAEECDVLVAFDKGSSGGSGTLNTINHAKKLNKKVVLYSKQGGE